MKRQSIIFARPQHEVLREKGYNVVDMHNHSCYSDTTTTLHTIAKKVQKLGLGVCLSDHNVVAGNIALAQRYPELFVVPGLEVTTKEMAHVLVYFYSHNEMKDFFAKHIKNKRAANPFIATEVGIQDLVDISKDYNCILAPAHPFAFPKRFNFIAALERGVVKKDVLNDIAAIEVICGANVRVMNKKAVAWAASLNKSIIGGSDSHSIGTLGRVVTVSEAHTVEDFLDSVRKRLNSVVGMEQRIHQRPLPLAKIVCKHLRYFKPTMCNQYELSIRQPALNAQRIFNEKFSASGRDLHREQIRVGMATLAEELHFHGFPRIKKGKIAMRTRCRN